MKYLLLIISICSLSRTIAQTKVGFFKNNIDIKSSQSRSSFLYNEHSQIYTLKSHPVNVQVKSDDVSYLYNKVSGDFILTANFKWIGEGFTTISEVGWMIRDSMNKNLVKASAFLQGDSLTVFQYNNVNNQVDKSKYSYDILQMERKGKVVIIRAAHFGEPLQTISSKTIDNFSDSVLAGLFIRSVNHDTVVEAEVWNVRVDQPVNDDYKPYEEGYLSCRLEILDPFNGNRKVIYKKSDRFEAPNWMPNGKNLLFNMQGSLYKIPINGGELEKLNTGFANRINNDHGISFDGKLLAISHNREGFTGGGSTIYTLPINGGEPKLVINSTPSYWHGWAPNNKELVYVAQRNGVNIYNIYKASIEDGKETQITNFTSGHVDGPEYSPDGKYIYYNSSKSGTMQLWRMDPNGSNQEQLTFDEGNDWFPHISPDGKWILYLTFPSDIPENSHPSYKQVMLRLMPANGGKSKVVAYLYGGQGTINVPSWSPDSKYVAFVSNSGKE